MKYRNIISVVALSSMCFLSCDDQKMEWYKDPSHGEVTVAELPLPLAEKISRYEALNKYTNFILGAGVGYDEYMNNEAYRNIVNENFDEIAVGYHMKHGPMVSSTGVLNFTNIDAMIAKLEEAGLTVYGHTLVWHSNQNAGYLNSLIAPQVIPAPAGANLVDVSGLEDGTFTGWGKSNNSAGITIAQNAGLTSTSPAVRLESTATSSGEWATQLGSPEMTAVVGHAYEFSFFVRSEGAGQGRLSFSGMSNNYPYINGGALFSSNGTWTQITYGADRSLTATSSKIRFLFDMGKVPSMVYYIDASSIRVTDLDATPGVVNLISNGTFEGGSLSPWGSWGNSSASTISAEDEGYGSKYAMKLTNPTDASTYSAQAAYSLTPSLEVGKTYQFSAMIKASVSATFQIQVQNSSDYSGEGYNEATIGTVWQDFTKQFTVTKQNMNRLCLNFGAKAATYYLDNIVLSEVQQSTALAVALAVGPTIIEKTDAQKTTIITASMEDWISKMVGHYKGSVKAWDVVNEPMDDGKPSSLKTGIGKTQTTDEFYWQDYMGKDYAVTAFKLARQYGNQTDKLFINDYNLEYSLAKCEGLIAYTVYIESQGAKVDGIGTQMHVDINTNKDNIAQMFQKLAATGKLIKISELDVKVNTATPTAAQFEQQAEMYRYILEMYIKYIPEAQRYGVTAWGISDNAAEHVNWIPNDAPNLWDANYARKHAYKGFADGLAGKDVSLEFSGELQ